MAAPRSGSTVLGPVAMLAAIVVTFGACAFPAVGPDPDAGSDLSGIDGPVDANGDAARDGGPADTPVGPDGVTGDRMVPGDLLSEAPPPDAGLCPSSCPDELRVRDCLCGLGDGRDGSLQISAGETQLIDGAYGGLEGTAGAQRVVAAFRNEQLAPGDLVVLHQTRGARAGLWELNVVTSHESTEMTLGLPLINDYLTSAGADRAQLVRVAQYSGVEVAADATLSLARWDGQRGGILALAAAGEVVIEGTIDASSTGLRGGATVTQCGPRCMDGQGGESSLGDAVTGTAASGNGGGGGEMGDCNMGGGGGHFEAGENGTVRTPVTACGSTGLLAAGGSVFGEKNLINRMGFGGGGGEGSIDDDGASPGAGGAGGGIVLVMARSLRLVGEGRLHAEGGNGRPPNRDMSCAAGVFGMGSGGGGAGGAILLMGANLELGDGLVRARGGSGGPLGDRSPCPEGSAGAGGDGRVFVVGPASGDTDPDFNRP